MRDRVDPRYAVVEWSGGGGFGHYAWLLADGITRSGTPAVLLTRRGHELEVLGGRHSVERCWRRPPRGLSGRLRRAVVAGQWVAGWLRVTGWVVRARARGPVVLHVQAPDRFGEIPFLAIARLAGARLLVTAHNPLPHDSGRFREAAQRLVLRLPDGCVVHTGEAAAECVALGMPAGRILVVPHGSYAPIAAGLPAAPRRPDGRIRLVNLGMLRPYKGLDVVGAVAAGATAGHADLDVRLAGRTGDPDGVLACMAGVPADRLSLRLGYLPLEDLLDELAGADLMLLAHRSGSESGVAHLALGAGVPVVAPDMGALARLLDGEPAWRYPPGDVEAAAAAVGTLAGEIRADPGAVRARARALAAAVPAWDAIGALHTAFAASVGRRPWTAGGPPTRPTSRRRR